MVPIWVWVVLGVGAFILVLSYILQGDSALDDLTPADFPEVLQFFAGLNGLSGQPVVISLLLCAAGGGEYHDKSARSEGGRPLGCQAVNEALVHMLL